jgi:hypothetical protein
MSVDTSASLPQWAVNALIWFALVVAGSFITLFGWIQRKYIVKVDSHGEQLGKLASIFATLEVVDEMDGKIIGLVSRSELLAYMKDLREEQLRMHKENLDNSHATRSDIRSVHERVDDIFRNGHDR